MAEIRFIANTLFWLLWVGIAVYIAFEVLHERQKRLDKKRKAGKIEE
jgi:hypothetical protein